MTWTDLLNALGMGLAVLFINATTWKGMVLDKIRIKTTKEINPFNKISTIRTVKDYLDRAPEWLAKPLWDCLICMTPWWSFGLGLPLFYKSWSLNATAIAFILISSGISVVFDTFVIGKREGLDG